jgi:hypothetical protein
MKKLKSVFIERRTRFKVTLRRVGPCLPNAKVAEVSIEVEKDLTIFNNRLYFSQDAKYFFIILVGPDMRL